MTTDEAYDALKDEVWEHLKWKQPILSFLGNHNILPDSPEAFNIFLILTREKTDEVSQAARSEAAMHMLQNGCITSYSFDMAEAKPVKGQLRYASSTIRRIAIQACDQSTALCVLMINMGFTPEGVLHDGRKTNVIETVFWTYKVSSEAQQHRLKRILEAMITHHPEMVPKSKDDYTVYSEVRRGLIAKQASLSNKLENKAKRLRI